MDFLIGLLLLTSKKRISSVQYHREVEKSTLNSTRSVLHVAAIFRQEVTYRVKLKSRKFVRWRLDWVVPSFGNLSTLVALLQLV